MTVRARLSLIGRALRGEQPVQEVIKEAKQSEKSYTTGFFLDYFKGDQLSSETRVSSKVLKANKGWVYKNTDVIAKEVSGIEFELFTTRIVGQEIQFNPVTSHAVLDLLDRFNEFTDASSGFYTTEAHRLLTGDSFWYLKGSGPNIEGIYPLPPDKIEVILGKPTAGQAIVQGFKYEDTIKGQRIEQTYKPEEIIHHKIPNPNNYYRGLGKVSVAADDIDTDWMAIEANKKMFQRGLIGSFVLTTENGMTPEQRQQLRAELTSTYGGIDNAFKIPVFSGGLEPKTIQLTNKDMEFIAQQTWVRDKISSIWGNPKSIITTDDVNRANADATILNWKQTTIRQEMKAITDTLNEFLVPRFGEALILGFKDPVPEDDTEDIEKAKSLKSAGIITRNEARELVGYAPVKGGDEFPEPFNPLAAGAQVPKSLRYVNYNKFFRKNGYYKKIQDFAEVKAAAKPIAKEMVKGKKKIARQNVDIVNYYEKQLHIVEAAELIFRQKVEKFIDRLVKKAMAEVPNEINQIQSKQLFDEEDELTRAVLDFTPILSEVAINSGNQALQLIDSSKPYILLDFRNQIRQRVELFAASMIDTDKNKLIDIITEGVRQGQSVPDIRRNINETFEEYTKMQAERITRTEVLRVSNQAALDAWDQSGVVEGKEWLTAPGADAECEQYNGRTVMNLSGNFYSPDNEFEDGDPPIHPNCRCVVIPIVADKSFNGSAMKEKHLKDQIVKLKDEINRLDKRTKEYKQKNEELTGYVKQLEDFLDE